MFGKNGTALSQNERAEIAKRRGVCLKCGTRTHDVKFMGRKAITNDDVYQGTCIKCYQSAVPAHILRDWQSRNAQVAHAPSGNRMRMVPPRVGQPRAASPMAPVSSPGMSHPSSSGQAAMHMSGPIHFDNGSQRLHAGLPTGSAHGNMMNMSAPIQFDSPSAPRPGIPRASSGSEPPPRPDVPNGPNGSRTARSPSVGRKGPGSSEPAPAPTMTRSASNDSRRRPPVSRRQLYSNSRTNSNTSNSSIQSTHSAQSESGDFRSPQDVNVTTLVEELGNRKDQPEKVKQYLHAIRNMAPTNGAMGSLKTIMNTYRTDVEITMLSMGAMWGVASSSDEAKAEAVSAGCLDSILEMLRTGKARDDVDAVRWAFGCLSSLARVSSNREAIMQKQGIEAILMTLKRHEKDPRVFEMGCRAIFSMVGGFEDDGSTTSFEREMLKVENDGGVRVIVAAMEYHLADGATTWWALNVLLCLAKGHCGEDCRNRLASVMAEEDVSELALKILKDGGSPACAMQCQELLVVLLSHEPNPVMLRSATGCIPTILQTLSDQKTNPTLHAVTATFLAVACRGNADAKRQVSRGPSMRTLLSGMASFPKDLHLQRAITKLLWTLSADQVSFDYSLLNEIKRAIEQAIPFHLGDKELSEALCGFLANILVHQMHGRPENVPTEHVVELARSAGKQGSRLLVTLCVQFPSFPPILARGGLVDQMITGLSATSIDTQAASAASLSLTVAGSDAVRAKVIASGALKTASAALLTAGSDFLVTSMLQLVMSVLQNKAEDSSVRVPNWMNQSRAASLEIPADLIVATLAAVKELPKQAKLGFTTIRNVLLLPKTSLRSVATDGILDLVLSTIESPSSSDDLVIEACGALWAYVSGQPIRDADVLARTLSSILRVCQQHGGANTKYNGPVLSEACGALAAVMRCVRDKPIHVADSDIDLVVAILDGVIESDVENADLMDRLMDVILSLCCFAKEKVIRFGGVVVVIDCMVEHEFNEPIQEKGCSIVAILASDENLQDIISIAETDGIDLIVGALAGFTENMVIQTNACRALSHLSIDQESRMLISSQGGLIMIVNLMATNRREVDLLEAACSALLNLSSDADEQILLGAGIIETVVQTMRQQNNSPKLQEKCIGVLQNLSMRSSEAKRSIAQCRGITAIVSSMREFMGTPAVLERCYTALWSLAVLEANQSVIAGEGGIGIAINAMMACIDSDKVQKQACGCLGVLSTNIDNKSLIRDEGGVDAIVYAMWFHYNSNDVLTEACRLIATLAVTIQTNEVMIAGDGEFSAILAAMRRFPESEQLQEQACSAIRNFLLSEDNVEIVRPQANDVEELIHLASARFPERCVERATQILTSLGY